MLVTGSRLVAPNGETFDVIEMSNGLAIALDGKGQRRHFAYGPGRGFIELEAAQVPQSRQGIAPTPSDEDVERRSAEAHGQRPREKGDIKLGQRTGDGDDDELERRIRRAHGLPEKD